MVEHFLTQKLSKLCLLHMPEENVIKRDANEKKSIPACQKWCLGIKNVKNVQKYAFGFTNLQGSMGLRLIGVPIHCNILISLLDTPL